MRPGIGSMVHQRIALLPHSKKIPGSILCWGKAFLCGVCMLPLCWHGFPLGILVPPTNKNMYFCALDHITALKLELVPRCWMMAACSSS